MTNKVWIDKTGNTLRLRWNYEGRKQSLSLGAADNPIGRALAKLKSAEIEKDLSAGYYDPSLLKYKPRILGANPTEITAVELFEKYTKFIIKDKGLARGSVDRYKAIASKLRTCLKDKPAHKITNSVAKDAVAVMCESLSGQTVKTYLFLIKACWDWGKGKYHLAEGSNPWEGCTDRVKVQPKPQIKPFNIAELQVIISAFALHPDYSHYSDFVTFLATTASRPGEAAGLRWKHLGANHSTAWIGESISRGHQNAKGTKTGKSRTIQLSPIVRSMLTDRFDRLNPQPNDLVFPSPKGIAIDDHNFNRRAWRTILESCHVEYRSPYILRHSAISHALANGANPIALAEQTGHDKRTMLSVYAHAIEQKCVFVDIGKA